MLHVSQSVLGDWNRGFDLEMRALEVPENRGKASKITVEIVRIIIRAAEEIMERGKRLRIKGFTKELREQQGIDLSKRKVREVLIANNLFAPETRTKRPRFYLSLRKEIPNGLLSLDGSEMVVWIDEEPYKFNVELGVDVKTFNHTSFSIGDSESSEELIKVIEAHRETWGTPVGVLFDHRSGNLSEEVGKYLEGHGIEIVPAGPYNAKGNGTNEGAFSQMKRALGVIRLNVSSPRELVMSVLEKLISLYIAMRNRISARGRILIPSEDMATPVTWEQRDLERQKLKEHNRLKTARKGDQNKLDQLHAVLRYHDITPEPDALKHAERSIKGYEREAISGAEEAFLKAVKRNSEKKSLSYFFGILVRIQREKDDEAYRRYCTRRYNEEVMMRLKRQQEEPQETHSVEGIVSILIQALRASVQFVKELAVSKAREWTRELMQSYQYVGALKTTFSEAIGKARDLTVKEKSKICELIDQILNPKTTDKSVTHIS